MTKQDQGLTKEGAALKAFCQSPATEEIRKQATEWIRKIHQAEGR